MILTRQGSSEFGILLAKIIKELQKTETENLELIKGVRSFLTVEGEPSNFAILEKVFSSVDSNGITLEGLEELKDFISQQCKVEPYVISPFTSVEVLSL